MFVSDFTIQQWLAFLLVLVRSAALIMTLPFLSSANLPPLAKVGLSMALAVFLFPMVNIPPGTFPGSLIGLTLLLAKEIMLGTILGLAVRMLLTAVQIMGQLVGFQMGFAVANVIDPLGGNQISVLSQFCFLVSILTMFSVGGHWWFFRALADSFKLVPPGDLHLTQGLMAQVMQAAADMFSLAIRIGAPVIAALIFSQVSMGILAKTVPQMNILIVGFPINIMVGLIFLSLTLSVLVPAMADIFRSLNGVLNNLLRAM